jgi:spore coat protein CotH
MEGPMQRTTPEQGTKHGGLPAAALLLMVPLALSGCKVLGEGDTIPGSITCEMPAGYEAPELPLLAIGDEDADAFFADDALPLFELDFPEGSWEQLCQNASDYADYMWQVAESMDPPETRHEYVEAILTFQGRTYEPVGVRLRGRTTLYVLFYDGDQPRADAMQRCLDRELSRKPSLKISMDEFGLDKEIADQQTFNLVAREGADSSYLREVLAHRMANDFGIEAPRANHGRVCLDGAYEGLYSLVEEADATRFVRQHFPDADTGGLWKVETDGEQVWSHYWDENGGWADKYIPKADTSETEPGRLRDLLSVGSMIEDGEPTAEIEAALDGLVDEDQWLREIALDMSIPDYDGMFGNHKNHLLYDHPERGFVVVPYDKDLSFVDLEEYSGGQCPGDIMGSHPCWSSVREGPAVARYLLETRSEDYLATVQDFVDQVMVPSELEAWLLARAEAMRPWLEADRYYRPDSPACIDDPEFCDYYTMSAWEWGAETYLPELIELRAEEVQRQLDGEATCDEPCGD